MRHTRTGHSAAREALVGQQDPWEQEDAPAEAPTNERSTQLCSSTGKVVHTSFNEATRQQKNLPRKGRDLNAYRCSFCGGWHLGNPKRR